MFGSRSILPLASGTRGRSDQVWRQFFDQLLQHNSACPACHVPDLRLEFVEGLWRDAPLAPIIRDAEAQELPFLRTALFDSLTFSRSFFVSNRLTEAMTRSPARRLRT